MVHKSCLLSKLFQSFVKVLLNGSLFIYKGYENNPLMHINELINIHGLPVCILPSMMLSGRYIALEVRSAKMCSKYQVPNIVSITPINILKQIILIA